MTTAATQERRLLAALLAASGPDAPTLCGDWTTRDLAAHLVIRDRRPDALPGIASARLAAYTDKIQRQTTESTSFPDLATQVGEGPPIWSPTRLDAVDRAINTVEFFVHHEDVRRAQPDWQPRQIGDELADDLHSALRRGAKMLVRRAPCGITLQPDDGRSPIVARTGEPTVTVEGPTGELVLWVYGRQAHTHVTYDGPTDSVAALTTAKFGI